MGLAALLVTLVVPPATALAGKKDKAGVHIAKATKAHKDGRFNEARVELEAAYAIDPKPELLYAIAQVYAKLGNCSYATTYYKLFVAVQTDPQVVRVVDQAIAACRSTPEPAAEPPPAPGTPPPGTPPPGTPPRPQASLPVSPPPDLRPSPTRGAAPLALSKPAPAPALARRRAPWYHDTVGDGLVLGGVAATIVGLIEYRRALSDLDAAEDRASTTSLARYRELVGDADLKRTMSIVFTGTGGVLVTAGIVRFVLHERTREVRAVGVSPAQGGGVITYRGTF
jgi:hypothetical protein